MKNLSHFPKTDIRFWQSAVFRQSYTRNGQRFLTKAWAMKVAYEGLRETFPLGTLNKPEAVARAREVYLFLAAIIPNFVQIATGVRMKSKLGHEPDFERPAPLFRRK